MTLQDMTFRPEELIPNAVFSPEGGTLSEDEAKRLGEADRLLSGSPELLCRACGWNTYHELCSSYLPRLRMFHTRSDSGLWRMGNDWLIWDRPGNKGVGTNEYMTYKFLRDKETTIPLVKEMYQFGKEGDEFVFTVMSRAKGVTLESVWAKLKKQEKRSYAEQIIAALRELRQFTALSPQRVDGSPLQDNIISRCNLPQLCKKILETKEEWLNNIDEELRVGVKREIQSMLMDDDEKPTPEALYDNIRTTFPDSAPFVLTHGDLNLNNIIVNDGKILAIIDWEHAGYYPWWVERWASYAHAASRNGHELFNFVWKVLSPELPFTEYQEKVQRPVDEAATACHFSAIQHTHSHDVWLRPRWCECKPFAGRCAGNDLGAELKHKIDYDVDKRRPGDEHPNKKFGREVAQNDEATPAENQSLHEQSGKVQL